MNVKSIIDYAKKSQRNTDILVPDKLLETFQKVFKGQSHVKGKTYILKCGGFTIYLTSDLSFTKEASDIVHIVVNLPTYEMCNEIHFTLQKNEFIPY